MLKWGAITFIGLLAILGALFAAVAWLVEPDELAALLETQIERATTGDATLGPLEFSLFPMPVLHVAGFELRDEGRTIAAAEDVRVGVSLLSALFGRVVLSGVELRAPRVHLEVDADGRPILPLSEGGGDPGGGPAIAVRSIRIENGSFEVGPWKAERIQLSGSLGLDMAVNLEGRLELAGVGQLTEQSVRITLGDAPGVEAAGEVVDFDLAALGRLLGREEVSAGSLAGSYRLNFADGGLRSAQADLLASGLELTSGGLRVEGDVPVRAQPGGRWKVDLGGAVVELGDTLHKPAGGELALSGASAGGDLRLHVGGSELPLRWDGGRDDGSLQVGPGALALEGVSSWVDAELAGRIAIEALELRGDSLHGGGSLESVELALPGGELVLSGPWQAEARTLSLPALELKLAEQVFGASLDYDLATGRLKARTRAQGVQLEPVLLAVRGRAELTGALGLDVSAEGPLDLRALAGKGSFEILDGELRGFSILEQVLGELAKFPVLIAAAKGRDLSKFDEERFESITAEFTLRQGRILVHPLTAKYRSGTAFLRGTIRVTDGALDLHGRIELAREVDEELSGEAPDAPTVIPIEGVRGTVARPKLILDRAAIASVATTLATRGKLGKQLDDALGPGGAEAVQKIFDQLLRGGSRKGGP